MGESGFSNGAVPGRDGSLDVIIAIYCHSNRDPLSAGSGFPGGCSRFPSTGRRIPLLPGQDGTAITSSRHARSGNPSPYHLWCESAAVHRDLPDPERIP